DGRGLGAPDVDHDAPGRRAPGAVAPAARADRRGLARGAPDARAGGRAPRRHLPRPLRDAPPLRHASELPAGGGAPAPRPGAAAARAGAAPADPRRGVRAAPRAAPAPPR